MLQQDLELERAALATYNDVLKAAKDDVALRHMLEGLIERETTSVEDIEKLLYVNATKAGEKESRLQKMA
jgi:bacterioferritin (cytochrome b1)